MGKKFLARPVVIVLWCGGRLSAKTGCQRAATIRAWWDTAVPSGIRVYMTRSGGQMANGRVAISPTAEPRPADLSGSMPQTITNTSIRARV